MGPRFWTAAYFFGFGRLTFPVGIYEPPFRSSAQYYRAYQEYSTFTLFGRNSTCSVTLMRVKCAKGMRRQVPEG